MLVNGTHYRTVWMEGRTVLMIDQKALPHSFRVVRLRDWQATAEAIRDMTVRGAGSIGAAAGFGAAQVVDPRPHAVGSLAGIPVVAQTVNAMNRIGPARKALEAVAGISAEAWLRVPHITFPAFTDAHAWSMVFSIALIAIATIPESTAHLYQMSLYIDQLAKNLSRTPLAIKNLIIALRQAKDLGFLGDRARGAALFEEVRRDGFKFAVVLGMGGYITVPGGLMACVRACSMLTTRFASGFPSGNTRYRIAHSMPIAHCARCAGSPGPAGSSRSATQTSAA